MAFIVVRREWDESHGYDGDFIDNVICGFDTREQAVRLLEEYNNLEPDVDNEYEGNFCRGKDRIPDVYYIKEIMFNNEKFDVDVYDIVDPPTIIGK